MLDSMEYGELSNNDPLDSTGTQAQAINRSHPYIEMLLYLVCTFRLCLVQ
jgi:hypothetical protein